MDLLYPAMEFYLQSEISRIAFAALTAVSGLIAAIIVIFQMRSATLYLINPWVMLAIYSAFVIMLLFLLGRYMVPVCLFYDRKEKAIIWVNRRFGRSGRVSIDASQIERVEFRSVAKAGGDSWSLALKTRDGSLHNVPAAGNRSYVRQSAERVARAAGVKVVSLADDGTESEGGEGRADAEPLHKRVDSPNRQPLDEDSLLITREKIDGGVRYDLGIPHWLTGAVFGFAIANLALGLFIWFRMSEEASRWASVPFLINTFIVFGVAAMLNGYKRSVEVTMDGIGSLGSVIPLNRLMDVTVRRGMIFQLNLLSDDNTITLRLTEKQAVWLKKEIEHQLWTRRAHIDK